MRHKFDPGKPITASAAIDDTKEIMCVSSTV